MTSRFGGWILTQREGTYSVAPADAPDQGFSAASKGRWNWAAFESREDGELLWISDGAGLRAFALIPRL